MAKNISVGIPEEIRIRLDRIAGEEGTSRSGIVQQALREYLLVSEVRALRKRLMPYAKAQFIFTDEDVFGEIS